jgi:hypothetical protein
MSEENVAAVRSIIPPPEVDLTELFRDDRLFEATAAALAEVTDPELECEAVWHEGRTYTGIEGVRQLWLDWLEPWTEYHSEAEEMIDAADRVTRVCARSGPPSRHGPRGGDLRGLGVGASRRQGGPGEVLSGPGRDPGGGGSLGGGPAAPAAAMSPASAAGLN